MQTAERSEEKAAESTSDAQASKRAAVEHDRRDLRVDPDVADPQYDDRVVSGGNELFDSRLHPEAGAVDENRTAVDVTVSRTAKR